MKIEKGLSTDICTETFSQPKTRPQLGRVLLWAVGVALLFLVTPPVFGNNPCTAVDPHCVNCSFEHGSGTCTGCEAQYELDGGRCIPCASLDPQCLSCTGSTCTACASGYGTNSTATGCILCSTLPNCLACSGGDCTKCPSGYGTKADRSECIACSSIDPQCTACSDGRCTACSDGYGPSADGKSCQQCSSIIPHCTACSGGKCNSCSSGWGLAPNKDWCIEVGTHNCPYSAGGQCCICPFNCQHWDSYENRCFGQQSSSCGSCQIPPAPNFCAKIDGNCTSCSGGKCTGCASGFEPSGDGLSCTPCKTIDANCTQCSDEKCTDCIGFYGPNSAGTACEDCKTIDANCTDCSGSSCTTCAHGYEPSGDSKSCIPCTKVDPNCTSCSGGKCETCGSPYAANLAGQCVKTGTSDCSYNLHGVCCKCQYDCLAWNPDSGSCVGAPGNGCGSCEDRQ